MSDYVKLRTEDTEQQAVIQWARMQSDRWPGLRLLHHIPNGGNRNKREAAKLKRMGVLAGVPDLHLPVACAGYYGLYIEMKYGDGRLLASQIEFMLRAAHFHNYCAVCYTAEDAIAVLQNYIDIDHRTAFRFENLAILKEGKQIGTVK
ncbi:MAG: VRR-NUC domain-containing protein [Mogibacterium sp.]|nr:VRR-NUC domain-containing protein [Mogibacterium sp.]